MDHSEADVLLKEGIFWEIKKDILFDKKSETFVDYLQKEKEKFDQPRSRYQKILALIGSLILGVTGIGSALFAIEVIIDVLAGEFVNPDVFKELPSEISTGLIFATSIGAFLGCILTTVTLLNRAFSTKSNWSNYHDLTLSLFRRLENADLLDNYVVFDKTNGKKRFQLKGMSFDFEINWVFPFIFDDFPPLLFELLLISFLLPFFVTTSISLFIAILSADVVYFLVMTLLILLIFFGFGQTGLAISRSWRRYSTILNALILKQQEVIHSLILECRDDMTIIRHQNNLTRLISTHSFPIPQLIRISAIIPLLGSLIGYLVALAAVT
jgi:hypothetical protein